MIRALALILLLAGCSTAPSDEQPAQADEVMCGSGVALIADLERQFGERPRAIGRTKEGTVIVIAVSDGGATWTIFEVSAGGVACLIATGDAWREAAPIIQGQGT